MGKILVTQNSLFKNQWGSLLKQLNVKNNTSAWNTLVSALRQYSPLTGTWDIQNGKIHPVAYLYVEHPGITFIIEASIAPNINQLNRIELQAISRYNHSSTPPIQAICIQRIEAEF